MSIGQPAAVGALRPRPTGHVMQPVASTPSAGVAVTVTATLTPTLPTDSSPAATATLTPTLPFGPTPSATAAVIPTLTAAPPAATATPSATPAPTEAPPAGDVGVIRPDSGGLVRSADGRVAVQFPPGAVEQPIQVAHQPLMAMDLPPDRHLFYRFELSAWQAERPEMAVSEFAQPVTVIVAYGVLTAA